MVGGVPSMAGVVPSMVGVVRSMVGVAPSMVGVVPSTAGVVPSVVRGEVEPRCRMQPGRVPPCGVCHTGYMTETPSPHGRYLPPGCAPRGVDV